MVNGNNLQNTGYFQSPCAFINLLDFFPANLFKHPTNRSGRLEEASLVNGETEAGSVLVTLARVIDTLAKLGRLDKAMRWQC